MLIVHTPIHASWLNQIELYFSLLRLPNRPRNFRDGPISKFAKANEDWDDPALASVKARQHGESSAAETARARRQSRSSFIILLRGCISPTHLRHAKVTTYAEVRG